MRGNPPSSASARTVISSVEERTLPPAEMSLSAKVARPSMNQEGCAPFGTQS